MSPILPVTVLVSNQLLQLTTTGPVQSSDKSEPNKEGMESSLDLTRCSLGRGYS